MPKSCIKGDERCPCLVLRLELEDKNKLVLKKYCSKNFDVRADNTNIFRLQMVSDNCTAEVVQISYSDKSESETYIP